MKLLSTNKTITKAEIWKKYFLKLGILDGCEGFFISIHTAYGKFLKYTKLRELNRLERPPKSDSTKK